MRARARVCVLIFSDVLLKDAQNFNGSKQTVLEKRSWVNFRLLNDVRENI